MKSDSQTTVVAGPRVQQLLQKLHAISDAEEKSWSQRFFYLTRLVRFFAFDETWSATADEHMRDKFVALDRDKCQFVYLLTRSIGACNVIEAGTSFGLSTIYLALAVGQNVLLQRKKAAGTTSLTGKVIATEKEHAKAVKARLHWKEAGDEVEPWIELREGDLLETLKVDKGMPERIDLLLLDGTLLSQIRSSQLAIDSCGHLLTTRSLDASCTSYPQACPTKAQVWGCCHHGQCGNSKALVQGLSGVYTQSRERIQEPYITLQWGTGAIGVFAIGVNMWQAVFVETSLLKSPDY